MTIPNKSHIGRRVKSDDGFIGKLLAIAGGVHIAHVIQREDGEGWVYDGDENEPEKFSLDGRGIKLGTKNLWYIKSYELMGKPLEEVKVGDWIQRGGSFRYVFGTLGEGEMMLVFTSYDCGEAVDEPLCSPHDYFTALEIKKHGWTVYEKEKQDDGILEMTLEEVAKLKGVSVEKLRIRY